MMKLQTTFAFALSSALIASVFSQDLPVVMMDAVDNPVGRCPEGSKNLDFVVHLDLALIDDNKFSIDDLCSLETIYTGKINLPVGTSDHRFCLNPWRLYSFNFIDYEKPQGQIDEKKDYVKLMWGNAEVFAKEIGTSLNDNDFSQTFGVDCGGAPSGGGDPHFKTLSGRDFDFHGQCDIVTLAAPGFMNGLGLDVHTRTKSRYQYSYIESTAVKIGDDVLEVGSYGDNFFNGVANTDFPITMGGQFPVTYETPEAAKHFFTIDLGVAHGLIIIKVYKDLVAISLPENVRILGDKYYGLLGQFNLTMDTVDREGSTRMKDMNAYGQEWQVRDTEPKLFQNVDHYPQWPEKCVMPQLSTEERRRLGEMAISEEQATLACKTAGRVYDMKACVYDVIATSDLEMASAGAF